MRPALQCSEAGAGMVLRDNVFIEQILPNTLEEMAAYRRPFGEPGKGRRPTLTCARQIPIEGERADVNEIVAAHAGRFATGNMPKLFVKAEPGLLVAGGANLAFARTLPAQTKAAG